jgi:indole-3-glycerol phosphate synthase
VLDGLFQQALLSSQRRQESISISDLESSAGFARTPIDVYGALAPGSTIKLIAEIKRASPSKGYLAEIPDAANQALLYQNSGAHAISVLTEESGFRGRLEDLISAREAVSIPLLRKDFISTEYQILEAKAAGADFVLLILSWLPETDYARLASFAASLGLGVLTETHTLEEIRIANVLGARLLGINTRNLIDFKTDIGLFEKMAAELNPEAIKVAESSVKSVTDVKRYRDAGADVVLVGEALVTGNPESLIPEFVSI